MSSDSLSAAPTVTADAQSKQQVTAADRVSRKKAIDAAMLVLKNKEAGEAEQSVAEHFVADSLNLHLEVFDSGLFASAHAIAKEFARAGRFHLADTLVTMPAPRSKLSCRELKVLRCVLRDEKYVDLQRQILAKVARAIKAAADVREESSSAMALGRQVETDFLAAEDRRDDDRQEQIEEAKKQRALRRARMQRRRRTGKERRFPGVHHRAGRGDGGDESCPPGCAGRAGSRLRTRAR